MTCPEFQKALPYMIEIGGDADEESHLKSCAVCSDLVQDLKYIAEQAKLLVPMEDPSPRVWEGIKTALEREGLVRPNRGTARFRPAAPLNHSNWGSVAGLIAVAALVLLAIGLLNHRNTIQRKPGVVASAPAPAQLASDEDDVQLLNEVQNRAPAMAPTYQESLNSINSYITDAKQRLVENPDDEQARDFLMRAYEQKAMLYQMALWRTLP